MGEAVRKVLFGLLISNGVVPVVAQPIISANGPLEFCFGESVTLCVEPTIYSSYLWSTGSTTVCITVTQSGEYWPSLLDSLGNIDTSLAATPVTVIVHRPEPQVYVSGYTLFLTESFESYQWYRNDSLIEGATDSFYIAPFIGNYYVEITDEYGCSGVSIVFETGPLNGIEDMVSGRFTVHPNPSTSIITLNTPEGSITAIALFDITGREVNAVQLSSTNETISLDVSRLTAGIYFGQVVLGETRKSFKWVKR